VEIYEKVCAECKLNAVCESFNVTCGAFDFLKKLYKCLREFFVEEG